MIQCIHTYASPVTRPQWVNLQIQQKFPTKGLDLISKVTSNHCTCYWYQLITNYHSHSNLQQSLSHMLHYTPDNHHKNISFSNDVYPEIHNAHYTIFSIPIWPNFYNSLSLSELNLHHQTCCCHASICSEGGASIMEEPLSAILYSLDWLQRGTHLSDDTVRTIREAAIRALKLPFPFSPFAGL